MSSLLTVGEEALSRIGLAATSAEQLDVVVGGLGLGYTARAALRDPRVRPVQVVDALAEVIAWHRRHLVPLRAELTGDPRCHLVHGDFFAMVAQGLWSTPPRPARFDVVLVDIDHSPRHVLHTRHASFYEPFGLRRLAAQLHPGGVLALWSNDPPDDAFLADLRAEFATADAHVVTFPNVYTGGDSSSTIYASTTAPGG